MCFNYRDIDFEGDLVGVVIWPIYRETIATCLQRVGYRGYEKLRKKKCVAEDIS